MRGHFSYLSDFVVVGLDRGPADIGAVGEYMDACTAIGADIRGTSQPGHARLYELKSVFAKLKFVDNLGLQPPHRGRAVRDQESGGKLLGGRTAANDIASFQQ